MCIERVATKMNSLLLRSKFRGCLLGSLIGDCCGAPFEGETFSTGAKLVLQNYFDKLEGAYFAAPVKKYTAVSSTSECVAQWLAEAGSQALASSGAATKSPRPELLARALARRFFSEPRRGGYTADMVTVFSALKATRYTDPFGPARSPQNHAGSTDNAAAARIAPVAVAYFHAPRDVAASVARTCAELTHSNIEGVAGALLQLTAIRLALEVDSNSGVLDGPLFVEKLIHELPELERASFGPDALDVDDELGHQLYQEQLMSVKRLLTSTIPPSDESLLDELGHSERALYSVPTALYCFLRTLTPKGDDVSHVRTNNPLRRAVQFAVSLGGVAAPIASMTGALAGAYYGEEMLNGALLRHCEGSEHFALIADALFDTMHDTKGGTNKIHN